MSSSNMFSARAESSFATSSKFMPMARDDFKKRKELDEARKAGTAPAEVDEDGKYERHC